MFAKFTRCALHVGTLFTTIIAVSSNRLSAQPVVTGIAPDAAPIGATVVISGTGFSATPGNNLVRFGAVRATVLSASSTTLSVQVPLGATCSPICVARNGFVGCSQQRFMVRFNGNAMLDLNAFDPYFNIATTAYPNGLCANDFDLDGKPDLAVENAGTVKLLSIHRNTSSPGAVSFAAPVTYPLENTTDGLCTGDLDGDGRSDLIVSNGNNSHLLIYRNVSSPGTISFSGPTTLTTAALPQEAFCADLDNDGRVDLAVPCVNANVISVFRNNGGISFEPKYDVPILSWPRNVAAADMDGDGKNDLVASTNAVNCLNWIKNNSTPGNLSFATYVYTETGGSAGGVELGDINRDGKIDAMVTTGTVNKTAVFQNTTAGSTITFAPKVLFGMSTGPGFIELADLNGDGRIDLCTTDANGNVSILRNKMVNGAAITSTSFQGAYGSPMEYGSRCLQVCDLDMDGAVDLITANYISSNVSIALNRGLEPQLSGFLPTSAAHGDTVVITGHNFLNATSVKFGVTLASWFQVQSDTVIRATVGAGSNGSVYVTNLLGTGSLSGFTFLKPTGALAGPAYVCLGAQSLLTLTGLHGLPPFRFGYKRGTGSVNFVMTDASSNTAQITMFSGSTGSQTYSIVSVQDAAGVTNTLTTAVTFSYTVRSLPNVTANNLIGCEGVPVNLSGSPASGTWTVPNPYSGPSTTYQHMYTDNYGCSNTSIPMTITMHSPANAGANGTLAICANAAGTTMIDSLNGSPMSGGIWYGPSSVTNGQYVPATMTPGNYTYVVTAPYCPDASAMLVVTEMNPTTWYADGDGDGHGDANVTSQGCSQPTGFVANSSDLCPMDSNKHEPGLCGCGIADLDTDQDGLADCMDSCPALPGAIGSPCDDADPGTTNDLITATCECLGFIPQVIVAARLFLEGCYDSQALLLRDDLRTAGVIPLAEPYSALGYGLLSSVLGTTIPTSALAVEGNNAIVDWVLVELRDAASPGSHITSRAALLQRDGDVVDVDGISPVTLNATDGDYYVAVRHRNHLGCMTASPMALSFSPISIDFTSPTTATYGTEARKNLAGIMLLWSGDVTFSGSLAYTGSGNDRDPVLAAIGSTTPNGSVIGYRREDTNMNAVVSYTGSGNDRDIILQNVGSTTPNAARMQQLP